MESLKLFSQAVSNFDPPDPPKVAGITGMSHWRPSVLSVFRIWRPCQSLSRELGKQFCSVSPVHCPTLRPGRGGKVGGRKGRRKGTRGGGWGGAGHISGKYCSASLTAVLVLGNPHHKDLSRTVLEQICPHPPFISGPALRY
jgi:hypothetical protein